MTAPEYWYEVSVDHLGDAESGEPPRARMACTDAAEAMAAWSKGITDGAEYIVIEALRREPAEGKIEDVPLPDIGIRGE